MDIFEAIEKRYSYRGTFTDQAPKTEDLKKITKAALAAPSGKNMQTTDFIIIDDVIICNAINKLHQTNKALKTARTFIACISDKNPEPYFFDMEFTKEDAAAATQNMLLAITALGYASVWVDGWLKLEGNDATIAKLINLPADKMIRILLPVGIPTKTFGQPPKKTFEQRVFFNSYRTHA